MKGKSGKSVTIKFTYIKQTILINQTQASVL